MGMGIRVADIRCPAVMVPTPIYVMASVIQMVLCPHDFRAAAKVITTTTGLLSKAEALPVAAAFLG